MQYGDEVLGVRDGHIAIVYELTLQIETVILV